MIIVANVNKIVSLNAKETAVLDTLTPKDRLCIVTDANALIPIALFTALSGLKTKPEIVSLPDKADSRAEAFLYGLIAAGAKQNEEVHILADMELSFPSMPNVKWVSSLTGGKTAARRTKPSAESMTAPVPGESAPVKRVRKPKEEHVNPCPGNLYKRLLKYPELKDKDTLIKEREADIAYCIQNASDAEIGFKFLLETKLGVPDGDTIWTVIHKDYDSLKTTFRA